jgi:hypothetical protein
LKETQGAAGQLAYVIYFVARAVAVDFLVVFFPELAMFRRCRATAAAIRHMLSTVCPRDVMGVDLRLSAFMHSAFVLFACFPKLSIVNGESEVSILSAR